MSLGNWDRRRGWGGSRGPSHGASQPHACITAAAAWAANAWAACTPTRGAAWPRHPRPARRAGGHALV